MGGDDRRKNDEAFKREVLMFMARIDQRNYDRDLAHAVQDECVVAITRRIEKLEAWRNWLTGAYVAGGMILGALMGHAKGGK